MSADLRLRFDVTSEEVSTRALREASREGFFAVGQYWDRHFKMRHFETGAEDLYHYQARTPAYLARKKRGWIRRGGQRYPVPGGGLLPLVYSGDTRAAVRQRLYPRAYPTRVTLQLPTPRYIRIRPYKLKHPPLGDELTRTTRQESDELQALYQRVTESKLNRNREQRRARM